MIIAKLDRLTRSVKDLCSLLELFETRGVALISVAESLDTASAAGRLVITIMAAVSPWEREAYRGTDAPLQYRPEVSPLVVSSGSIRLRRRSRWR